MKRIPLILMSTALLFACGKKDEKADTEAKATIEAKAPEAAPPVLEASDGGEAVEAAASDEQVPTIEDFEEEANAAITEDNLEQELAALEKELEMTR